MNPAGGAEEHSGYNSEDECVPHMRDPNMEEKERWFEQSLKEKRGFIIKRMGEDGACLFRSVADQVYGDQEMHSVVRQLCVDYMAKNCDFFKQYVTEDFNTYLNRKRLDTCHGNHIEMQALCELFNRPIEVYQLSIDPINTFHSTYKTDNEPIRLSYHGNVHYNSVVDPRKATIGVGLGLPGFQPGLADKNLIRDALRQSEDCQIEQTMLEDKLRETDWELTQETIEEQVARESYLQWLQEQEKYNKVSRTSPRSACATCSTATDPAAATLASCWDQTISPEPRGSRSPRSPTGLFVSSSDPLQMAACGGSSAVQHTLPGGATSPLAITDDTKILSLEGAVGGVVQPSTSFFSETTSIMNEIPPQMFGFSEWEDDVDILARVIAQSQHEYLASLKKNASNSSSPSSSSSSASTSSSTSAVAESVPVKGLANDDLQRPSIDKGKSIMPKDRRN
jgi:OTU domain-containing protein 5